MKVLIKSPWGVGRVHQGVVRFLHANAFAEAGHEVRLFLLGEAANLMKDAVLNAVTPVGWPPLRETFAQTVAHAIPVNI